ncbi:MAG: bifunctional diaminohydroxyphosphoribosylaminopyrimidine deaminase/5-amino-6-(5-phosphoribosylamino)uracil reductase RibD [Candidatus Eremiobacteraeota bacterium]|nr:bifunctional diaminohydroxyphosphoribosylaminopyrimidine deaminase/5-amino-6-(5-phosphoribosylamino)uracil reductase RibD [Candidatus Eremiobacteraeota bacterium]
MERRHGRLKAQDRLYLERAFELAVRGSANTAPNPPVGAVIVRNGEIVGEGYHHVAGSSHAEVEALRVAGPRARGATMYVSLEPCNHTGKTPPCSRAVIEAGLARVVIGALDPNPKTARGGMAALRDAKIDITIADEPQAKLLIESFTHTVLNSSRPYVSLKMASSIDGYIAPAPGDQYWLTGSASRDFVRDLRIGHDAVMVGAGTVRIDDPQLTVRPAHTRLRPYARIIVCETDAVPADRRVLASAPGYERTIVLAPAGVQERFATLSDTAEVLFVGSAADTQLDLAAAMKTLRRRGFQSILCEGGPTLAARLLAAGLIDRLFWLIAPKVLANGSALPVLNLPSGTTFPSIGFDRVERLGDDILISGAVKHV